MTRDETIESLFPLLRKIARRVHRLVPGASFDDLIGEGCVGLIRAVDSYDPQRGTTLEGYATKVVAGAMLNGLRRSDPVSERVRREIREADRERYALASERGQLPSRQEMEERRPALRRAMIHAYRYAPLSLDSALPDDESLAPNWNDDPARLAVERNDRLRVHAAMNTLSLRQRRVLHLHYYAGRSLHDIGTLLKVSPQRASQLHLAALHNLRKALHVAPAR